jgi:hypothetical protein
MGARSSWPSQTEADGDPLDQGSSTRRATLPGMVVTPSGATPTGTVARRLPSHLGTGE